MEVGKLKASDLRELIFNNIEGRRKEILTDPKIGGDCAVMDFGEKVAYISSDPITGTSEELGKLAVNINCNDIATAGVEPVGLMLTILAPEGTTREELDRIMRDAQAECKKIGVSIIGGHTEITRVVNQIVASVTAIGIGDKKDYKSREETADGDILVLTKGVGIEGTGIIAYERENDILENLGEDILVEAKGMLDKTSVVKEGLVASSYVKGMHDVTEGGILGAVWEMSEFYGLGAEVYREKLVIHRSTKALCDHFQIDPLRLISSGSMLLVVSPENYEVLGEKLSSEGIEWSNIGRLTEEKSKVMISGCFIEEIGEPESDELYKVV